ncbi:hypothetical protein PGQ11_015139 [Apiospora arundinis]|uniref:Uncharacterized protein n=1 Tax=Apiospora arundinis TaxID=335852 RepID=A0ABR2HKH5_9PEZI
MESSSLANSAPSTGLYTPCACYGSPTPSSTSATGAPAPTAKSYKVSSRRGMTKVLRRSPELGDLAIAITSDSRGAAAVVGIRLLRQSRRDEGQDGYSENLLPIQQCGSVAIDGVNEDVVFRDIPMMKNARFGGQVAIWHRSLDKAAKVVSIPDLSLLPIIRPAGPSVNDVNGE